MLHGFWKKTKWTLFAIMILMLISAATAGNVVAIVFHDVSVFFAHANIHAPHITPPKVHG